MNSMPLDQKDDLPDSAVTYAWEPLNVLLSDGAADLVRRHYQEIALDQDKVPLVIDWHALLDQERQGSFRIFAARRGGKIIGYVSFKLFRPERYRSTLYVNEDVFFIVPEERHGLTGYRLLKSAIAGLPRPCKLQMKTKIGFEGGRVGLLLERLGLKPIETVYCAVLE